MIKQFKEINRPFLNLFRKETKNVLVILCLFFGIYFTYSSIRSSTDALFVHQSGAAKTPFVWLLSVIFLSLSITTYNYFQKKFGLKKFFFWTSLFSALSFALLVFLNVRGYLATSYALFILKEIYIVLLVHLGLAYCNNFFTLEEARAFYGPFGAIGSIGSTFGGEFASWWIKNGLSTFSLLYFSAFMLFLLGPFFLLLKSGKDKTRYKDNHDLEGKFDHPIQTLKNVKEYVFFILFIVALSQFCINIANLQFNLKFAEVFSGTLDMKTEFMGRVYAFIGLGTLIIQFFIVPPALTFFKARKVHFFIPISYMCVSIAAYFILGHSLWIMAAAFIFFKAMDYSLFSSAKEMLYFSLSPGQKVGAKYLTDMVVYRLAKGLISLILIYMQSFVVLSFMLIIFMGIWLLSVIKIFKYQKILLEKKT